MQLDIWECSQHHIHLNCDGFAIQFQDFEEFRKAIALCQEYIERYRTRHTEIPKAFQEFFNESGWE